MLQYCSLAILRCWCWKLWPKPQPNTRTANQQVLTNLIRPIPIIIIRDAALALRDATIVALELAEALVRVIVLEGAHRIVASRVQTVAMILVKASVLLVARALAQCHAQTHAISAHLNK